MSDVRWQPSTSSFREATDDKGEPTAGGEGKSTPSIAPTPLSDPAPGGLSTLSLETEKADTDGAETGTPQGVGALVKTPSAGSSWASMVAANAAAAEAAQNGSAAATSPRPAAIRKEGGANSPGSGKDLPRGVKAGERATGAGVVSSSSSKKAGPGGNLLSDRRREGREGERRGPRVGDRDGRDGREGKGRIAGPEGRDGRAGRDNKVRHSRVLSELVYWCGSVVVW